MIPVKKKNLADNKRKASRDEKEISIIMKKRYALLLTGLLTLSLAAGCGAKTDNAGETSSPAVSESQAAESTCLLYTSKRDAKVRTLLLLKKKCKEKIVTGYAVAFSGTG